MDDKEYLKLLDRAYDLLPEKAKRHERFEIPKVLSFIEGTRTIIKNLDEISNALMRDKNEIFTYLLKELASRGEISPGKVIIERALRPEIIDEKIKDYAHDYVLCWECGKPDTKVIEFEGKKVIKCMACGSIRPYKKR
ncbi:MAG: translation initiation factor IF-2 subunit beta [Candidatus Altarchaeaceae archaeon]